MDRNLVILFYLKVGFSGKWKAKKNAITRG